MKKNSNRNIKIQKQFIINIKRTENERKIRKDEVEKNLNTHKFAFGNDIDIANAILLQKYD